MLFHVYGLDIKPLQKANDKTVFVDIVANHLTEDEEGEIILKEAFDDPTMKKFIDVGVIEYWHESRNPRLTKEEKNQALMGKPVSYRWEGGKPIVTAELTKSHPRVQEMLPHLEANNPLYAASVGGSKMVLEVASPEGQKKRVIPQIKFDHLAIAPRNSVINREPGVNVKLLRKANDLCLEFDNMDTFISNAPALMQKEEALHKALLAPESVSDLYESPSGVIAKQDLEKSVSKLTLNEDETLLLIETLMRLNKNEIPTDKDQFLNLFEKINKRSTGDKIYSLITQYNNKRSM